MLGSGCAPPLPSFPVLGEPGAGCVPKPGCAGSPGWGQVAMVARPRCGLRSCLPELLSNPLPSSSSEMQIPGVGGSIFGFP